MGEYLIYEGKHEGIVSEELFNAAQEKKSKNPKVKKAVELRNPLSGLIFCRCGRAMTYRPHNNKDGTERCAPRLLCANQKHCKSGSCLFNVIIDRVCETLEQCIEDFEIRIQNNEGDSEKLHLSLIKSLEKKMKDLNAKELAQWEQQSHPDESQRMPAHIFKQLNERLLKEKEEVQQALCNAYESMPEPVDYEEKLLQFKEALEAMKDPEADALKKNSLLRACIDRIECHRERPERLKKEPGEKKGTRFKTVGGRWTDPPIELDIKLKV